MRRFLAAILLLAGVWAGSSDLAHSAHQDGNLICQTTTTAGQGTVDLVAGGCDGDDWNTFVSQITSGNTVTYTLVAADGTLETGIGTFTDAATDTISRDTVLRSSLGTTKLTLSGTTRVYLQWNTASYQNGLNAFDIASLDVDSVTGVDTIDATTESTIEAALDTLANVTSVQGRTVTLADAGANAIFGWDDVAGAYENLTAGEVEAIVEPEIDTLANLTSIQSRTVTLADAGANAFFGWDDVAGAYENLTDAEAEAIMEPLIDTLANLTSIQSLTVTLADAGANAVLGWDDTAGAYENLTATEVENIIEGADGSGSGLDADLLDGISSASFKQPGTQTIWVTAGAMAPDSSAACTMTNTDLGSGNDIVCAFSTSTQQWAEWYITMPKSWNEGSISAIPYWTAFSSSGGVVWGIGCGAVSNDDPLGSISWGSEATSTDTLIATSDLHIAPSATVTAGGTPVTEDLLACYIGRVVANGSDTLAADAYLLGVKITYTDDAANDN